jgi:hypothetical protein
MVGIEEMEDRLQTAEATLQTIFCTVTADLIMFQAAVTALREEGILTDKIIDRMAIDAQLRLQQYESLALSEPMVSEIATQLDGLAERLRGAAPSAPLVPSGNGRERGTGDGRARR